MSDCEWRYDLAGGELLNSWTWSDVLSFEEGREAMQKEHEMGSRAPIMVKVPPGVYSKVQRFANPQDALNYLIVVDPCCIDDLSEKANLAKQQVLDKEKILVESQEAEQVARAKFGDAEAKLTGKVFDCGKVLDWRYGDPWGNPRTLKALENLAEYNPFRWRNLQKGPATFPSAVAEFEELAKSAANEGQPQRPVILKIPPGPRTPEQRFDNFDAAIAFLKKEEEDVFSTVAKAREEHEHAKAQVTHAQEQLHTAKKVAKEAEAAFTAGERKLQQLNK